MSKRFWTSVVLAAALAAPGCRMCCPSYDYCGPTNPGESNSGCCGMSRRGSIFSGYSGEEVEYVEEGTVIEEQAQPIPDPMPVAPAVPMGTQKPTPAKLSSRRTS